MAKYNVHGGHNAHVTGASSKIDGVTFDELTEDRIIKNKVISYLKAQGHTVYDCTDDSGTTKSKNLSNIVAKCNAHNVNLDISIHFNSGANNKGGNGKTTGTEVWIYPNSSSKSKAQAIANEIAKIGFKNRGVKTSRDLYVLKRTKSPALLIEVCFVDDKDDYTLYKANVDNVAKAIVKGITGKAVTTNTNAAAEKKTTPSSTSYKVKITADVLNVRKGASTSYSIVTTVKKNEIYTIVGETNGWGKLKSGVGWIKLSYTKKV